MTEPKKKKSRSLLVRTSKVSLKSSTIKNDQETVVDEEVEVELPRIIDYSISIEDRVAQSYYDFLLPSIIQEWKQFDNNNKRTMNTVSSDLSVISVSPQWNLQVSFRNGNTYRGEISNNRLNGNGVFRWANGTQCEGIFINNHLEGYGTIMYPDEARYTGYICCGYRHKKGLFKNELYSYSGEYLNCIRNGHGILISEGQKFDGFWKNGIRVTGTRYYKNEIFIGEFTDNEEKKNGSYYFINGDIYTGNWLDNMFSGYGKYTWKGNIGSPNRLLIARIFDNYEGFWKENKRNGLGILSFGEKKIIGIWQEDIKNGPGIMCGENGNIYMSPNLYLKDKYCFSKHVHITSQTKDLIKELISIPNCFELDDRFIQEFKELMDECDACFCVQKRSAQIFEGGGDTPIDEEETEADPEPENNQCIGCITYELENGNERNFLSYILHLHTKFGEVAESNVNPILIPCHNINLVNTPIVKFVSELYPNADYNDVYCIEIRSIHQLLIDNISLVENVYDKYARLCSESLINYKPIMTLFALWQFSRDILLHERNINIYQTICDADKEFNLLIFNYNNPFELIYFWQFIKYLLYVTMLLNQDEFIKSYSMSSRPKCFGQFGTMFLMFFRDFVVTRTPFSTGFLPNIILSNETLFHDFIENFQELKSPMSVRNVLQFIYGFKVKRIHAAVRDSNIQFQYLYQSVDSLTRSIQDHQAKNTDWFFKTITFKKCFEIINEVFPNIFKNDIIVKTDFNVTGVEFFEIIIKLLKEHLYNEKFLAKKQELIAAKLEENAKAEEELKKEQTKGGKKKKK